MASPVVGLALANALAAEPIIETLLAPATSANPRNSESDIVVLKDGTLLAAWSDFYGGASDFAAARISAAKSTDGGRTWSERFTLLENSGSNNVMSVSFLRPKSGGILFFYLVKNSKSDLKVFVRRSDDESKTWSEPVCVTPQPGYHVMNNARAVQLKDGRIVSPVSFTEEVRTREGEFRNVMFFSDDDGRIWKRGKAEVICPKRGAMEPGVIELKDGRLLQIIRTQLGMIWHAHSADRGDTWTEAKPWTIATPESPSTLARLPGDGDFLLIYNPNVKPGTDHSGPRTPLAGAISSDEGKTWSKPKLVESDLSSTYAYTSVTFHEGHALLTYYVAKGGQLSLKFKSLPLDWFRE